MDVGCRPNHVKSCVVYFLTLFRDYVCLFPCAFFPSLGIRACFVYTLEIRSAETNQRHAEPPHSQPCTVAHQICTVRRTRTCDNHHLRTPHSQRRRVAHQNLHRTATYQLRNRHSQSLQEDWRRRSMDCESCRRLYLFFAPPETHETSFTCLGNRCRCMDLQRRCCCLCHCQDLKLVALSISSSRLRRQKTGSSELKNSMVQISVVENAN